MPLYSYGSLAPTRLPERSPEDQRGFFRKYLGDPALSTLGYIGESLDKPRRALAPFVGEVVEAFGGPEHDFHAREMLNVIPFSDAFGITNPADATYGKDLLGYDDPDLWRDDIAGFGAEVLTDPLTYVGGIGLLGKGVTRGAKALKNIGKYDEVIEAAARASNKTLDAGMGGKWDHLGGYQPRATGMQNTLEEGINLYKRDLANKIQDPNILRQELASFDSQLAESLSQVTRANPGQDLRGILNEPLNAAVNVRIPFTRAGIDIGSGRLAQTAAVGSDMAVDAFNRLGPVRTARSYFDSSIAPRIPGILKTFPPLTNLGRSMFRRMTKEAEVAKNKISMQLGEIDRRFKELELFSGTGQKQNAIAVRKYLEHKTPEGMDIGLSRQNAKQLIANEFDPSIYQNFQESGVFDGLDALKDMQNEIYNLAKESGLPTPMLDDMFADHFYRQVDERFASPSLQDTFSKESIMPSSVSGTGTIATSGRENIYRDLPGGTGALMELSTDPNYSGMAIRLQQEAGVTRGASGQVFIEDYKVTELAEQLLQDPKHQGVIRQHYIDPVDGTKIPIDEANPLHVEQRLDHAKSLVERISKLDTRYADKGVPWFNADPVKDTKDYVQSLLKATKSTDVIFDTIADFAAPASQLDVADRTSLVDLLSVKPAFNAGVTSGVFKGLGLADETGMITDKALERLVVALAKKGKASYYGLNNTALSKDEILGLLRGENLGGAAVSALSVPTSVAQDLSRAFAVYTSPNFARKQQNIFSKLFDNWNNAWKRGVTTIFAPFHERNRLGGLWTNYVGGILDLEGERAASEIGRRNILKNARDYRFDPEMVPLEYKKYVTDEGRIRFDRSNPEHMADVSGGVFQPLTKQFQTAVDLEDSIATQILMHEIGANGIWSSNVSIQDIAMAKRDPNIFLKQGRALAGDPSMQMGDYQTRGQYWGNIARTTKDVVKEHPIMTAADAVSIYSGVGAIPGALFGKGSIGGRYGLGSDWSRLLDTSEVDVSALYYLGDIMGAEVEFMNRVAPYLGMRRKGINPMVAAQKVAKAQIDYSALTHFESTVMRKIFPFYSFTRGMLPNVLEDLVTNPGGARSLAVRLTEKAQRDGGFKYETPSWLREQPFFPVQGMGDDFSRTYINLGLPFGDTLNVIPFPSKGSSGMFRDLAGDANPIVKSAFEAITDQDVSTGRPAWSVPQTSGGKMEILPGYSRRRGYLGKTPKDVTLVPEFDSWRDTLGFAVPLSIQEVNPSRQRGGAFRTYLDPMIQSRTRIDPRTNREVPVFRPVPGYYRPEATDMEYWSSPEARYDNTLEYLSKITGQYFGR